MLSSRRLFVSVLLAGLGTGLVACKKKEDSGASPSSSSAAISKPIVIGHYASMTGSTAHFGQDTDKAVRLAVDEINQAGGVNGRKIEVVTLDDRGDSAEASNAVARLIDVEKGVRDHRRGRVEPVALRRPRRAAPQDPHGLALVHEPEGDRGRGLHLPRLLPRSVPGQGDGELRPRHPEARLRRDPEGREERLLDRSRRRVPRRVHRGRRQDRRRTELLARRHRFQRPDHRHQGQRRQGYLHPGIIRRSAPSPALRSASASKSRCSAATAGTLPIS